MRARIDELSERKKTATSELSGLQRKLLFGNKRRQQELTAEIGALERRMANDRIVADRLENELKARNAEIAQTDKSSSILALKQKERSLEAELRRIESDLENQEDDFTVANMYNGLTKEFRDAFERDCVKAAHDYRDDAAIKRMALKLHGLADA